MGVNNHVVHKSGALIFMTSISMMLKVVRMPLLVPKFRQNLKHIACKEIASHTCRSVLFGFLDSVMKEMCSSGDHKLCFFVLIYASLTSNTLINTSVKFL